MLTETSKKLDFGNHDLKQFNGFGFTQQDLIERICMLEREIGLITSRLDRIEQKENKKPKPTVEQYIAESNLRKEQLK